MTKDELIEQLRALNEDTEQNHIDADALLLAYINDPDITDAYQAIAKWYA